MDSGSIPLAVNNPRNYITTEKPETTWVFLEENRGELGCLGVLGGSMYVRTSLVVGQVQAAIDLTFDFFNNNGY